MGNDPFNKTDPTGQYECVNNGDGTLTCTTNGSLVDLAAALLFKAAVEAGILQMSGDKSDEPPIAGPGVAKPGDNKPPPDPEPPGIVFPFLPPPDDRGSTPMGSRRAPMDVAPGTNSPETIGGRQYSGHALDQMQGRGITPSAVENTIRTGTPSPDPIPGRTRFVDTVNRQTVVVDSASGRVVTVIPGVR